MKNFVAVSVFFTLLISCGNKKENKNFEELQRIKSGMSYKEVNKIMTYSPKNIESAFWDDKLFVNYYDSPPAASDDYGVVFTKKDSIVVKVLYGD